MDKRDKRVIDTTGLMASHHRDRLRLRRAQALPRQARDQPVELLAREAERARSLARLGEAVGLQAPGAQPHAAAVVDEALQAAPTRRVAPSPGTSRPQDALCPGLASILFR